MPCRSRSAAGGKPVLSHVRDGAYAFEWDAILIDYEDYQEKGTETSRMFNPRTPAKFLPIRCCANMAGSVCAEQLGMTRTAISRIIHGKAAISTHVDLS